MDDDQQFCLRWNNHQSTLVSVFDNLLEKGMHVDCTLAAEGQTLKAHKVVLSACSPYFESVLSQQYDKHPIIILKDVKYAELRAMMDYMYRGEVNISQDQLAALLKAAESLQIKGLSDNKPSRPPSRPAQAVPAHPPRAPSPPPQPRDGSIDSREGSVSPTRRRKKARRMSHDGPPPSLSLPPPNDNAQGNGDDQPQCKEEVQRDGVEDLTLDEEADDQPAVAHNDVVRNFQWHMERSQDDIMNSSDGARESQEVQLLTLNTNYAKTPFPLTRGYFKNNDTQNEDEDKDSILKKVKKIKNKLLAGQRRAKKKLEFGTSEGMCRNKRAMCRIEKGKCRIEKGKRRLEKGQCRNAKDKCRNEKDKDRPHVCSICKKKQYKYRRNKLRHEKYECITGPQFGCDTCGRKYSQKKTLISHVALKHPDIVKEEL